MKEKNVKENKKKSIKFMKTVKILTIVFLIVLVSMIGFFGIYEQNKNQMSNIVKDYSFAMDLNGARVIKLKLNTDTESIVKDSEGNVVKDATDEEIEKNGYTKEEIPNNSQEVLTTENYKNTKKIIEKRLKNLAINNYQIGLNEQSGEIIIEVPENSDTDAVVGNLTTIGKFEIIDSETKEVLLDNNDIKSSQVLYNTTTSGTAVFLQIEFNKNGKRELQEISTTYVNSVDNNVAEENNTTEENTNTENTADTSNTTTEKKVTMKIDDEEIMSTSFDEPLTTGKIQLSIGSATTDTSALQEYITQAQSVAVVLDSGKLPIKYDISKNQYVLSDITEQNLINVAIVIAVIAVIAIIILIIKYKLNGLLAGFSYIGLASLFLLLVRYTNVTISIESIFGIVIMLILNYIFTITLLSNIEKMRKAKKENIVNKATAETYTKFFVRIIPICIMVIAFCFVKWIPISSFGMIAFWGLVIIAVYNSVITRSLLKIKEESK